MYFGERPVDRAMLGRMTSSLIHRGPDDEGIFVAPGIGLGMRRLSIVDLAGGKQPIFNEAGDIVIVFNGEIYNYDELRQKLLAAGHVLKTRTDTEVIVHLYEDFGVRCLDFLDGMFAFAVWDIRARRLFLARDRLGEKPLYYASWPGGLVFGSEMKAVLASDAPLERSIDLDALSLYFTFMTVPSPLTILKSVQKLPPAHYILCKDSGDIELRKYWDVSDWEADNSRSEESYLEEFEARFNQAVRERLIGDVPIGAFLSGGVDSSAVVAHMGRLTKGRIKTFAVRFEGPQMYDETPYASRVAKHCSTDHTEVTVAPDILADLPKLIWHWDEPFAVASAVPLFYMAKLAREHVKVVVTGDGGDEVFAGYTRYIWDGLVCRAARFPWLWSRVAPRSPRLRNLPASVRLLTKLLTAAAQGPDAGYAHRLALFTEVEKEFLLSGDILVQLRDRTAPSEIFEKHYRNFTGKDKLARRLYGDLHVSLPDEMLTKVDRMTMAAGLEARPPFLDHQLVEFLAKVPSTLKVKNRIGKYLLKKHAAQIVPRDVIYRPKHGFQLPLDEWLRGQLKDVVNDVLTESQSFTRQFLKPDAVRQILAWHVQEKKPWGSQIWAMFVLELWGRMLKALPQGSAAPEAWPLPNHRMSSAHL